MSQAPRFSVKLPLLVVCLCGGALAVPSAAVAAETSATVSVRVEGVTETKLPATLVTTSTEPFTKDGNPEHTCAGTSAAGALQLATGGNWGGTWFKGLGYSVETILGESHIFEEGSKANYFWSFWLDEKEASTGVCEAALQPGDRVLLFPECFGELCPPTPLPLGIEAPASAAVGEPALVTIKRYSAGGEASPVTGATVEGGGASAATDAAGHATLSFSTAGEIVVRASAPESVRTEATVCVHNGNDGTCGTPGSSSSSGGEKSGTGEHLGFKVAPYKGPFAIVASASGLLDSHVYARGHGPRLLTGAVSAHTAVTSVALELRRRDRGRCSYFDGVVARFVHAPCYTGRSFALPNAASFSYLLPAPLGPGRYVLDLKATDAAGNATTLARGTSRIVFYVRG